MCVASVMACAPRMNWFICSANAGRHPRRPAPGTERISILMHCARYCGKPSGSYPLPDAADDIFTNGGSRVDLHDFSSKIAEATRNLSPAERESLRKIFEGVSAEILQESAHALSSSGTPAACAMSATLRGRHAP